MLIYREEIASTYESVDEVVREIVNRCKNVDELNIKSFLFKMSVILREILNNAVEHGNKFDPEKSIYCEVTFKRPVIEFTIADEGEGIEIEAESSNSEDELLSVRTRGFKIIKKMRFDVRVDGNKVIAAYNLANIDEE